MRRWIAVIWAGLVFLTGCKQPNEEPIKDLSILLHDRSVELQYGASKDITFSAEDFDGNVTVSSSNMPDGISVSYVFDKASGEGSVTVTSSLDEDAENTVKLNFSDNRMTVSENLKIITYAKPVVKDPFEVETDSDAIELSMDAPSVINYTAKHFNDNVSVSLPKDEKDIILSVKFNPENGKGELSFSPAKDQTLDKNVTLLFTSGEETVIKDIKVIQNETTVDFSVSLAKDAVELTVESDTKVSFTAQGYKDDVTVSLPSDEKDITLKSSFDKNSGNGELTFNAVKDQELDKTVTLSFSNGKESVSKNIKVTQAKVEKDFVVTLDNESIEIELDKPAGIGYTSEGFKNDIAVSLPSDEKDFTVANSFDNKTCKGTVTFSATKDQELNKTVVVTFESGNKTVGKSVKITQKRKPVEITAPEKIELKADSDIIYPETAGIPFVIDFTVQSESDFLLDFEMTDGLYIKETHNQDNRTGKIELFANGNLKDSGTLTVRAYNNAGEKRERLTVRKAVLNIDRNSYNAPFTGGEATVRVSTNVGYSYKITDNPDNMISVSKNADVYTVKVSENPNWESRTAKVVFTDEKGFYNETFTVSQDPSQGSPATDKAALMNIYNALNGPNWPDQGGGGDRLYSHWGNDDDIRNWYGVTIFYSGAKAQRVRNLVFIDVFAEDYTLRRGDVPEDLGRLSYLQELRINKSAVTSIPNSIGNLKDMRSVLINENPLNFKLESHEGIKNLIQNAKNLKEFMLINCGLYGSIPEWVGDLYGGKTELDRSVLLFLECNYLSGQVPDKVAKSSGWINPQWIDLDRDGYYEKITAGELIMRQQGGDGSYALWVGEKPDNVKFVNDSHGGHWEWIGQNPYRDNSRYKKDYDQGTDPDKGFGYYNDYGHY